VDFNEARDNGVAVASAGPYANHLHLARQITTQAPHNNFVQARCSFWYPTNSVNCQSTEGIKST